MPEADNTKRTEFLEALQDAKTRRYTTQELAVALAKQEIPVFPCRRDKAPAIPRGFKNRSADVDQVRAWFADETRLIGIVPWDVGCVVIDLDVDKTTGECVGDIAFTELEDQHGLVDTMTVRTPSGGVHLWLGVDRPYSNRADNFPDGIDIRGGSGYVFVPSGDSGYVLEDAVEGELGIADAPAWVVERLSESNADSRRLTRPVEMAEADMVGEGGRNAWLTSQAGRLLAGGVRGDALRAALAALNESMCSPPASAEEVEAVANSVLRYEPPVDPEKAIASLGALTPPSAPQPEPTTYSQARSEHDADIMPDSLAGCVERFGFVMNGQRYIDMQYKPGVTGWPECAPIADIKQFMVGSDVSPATGKPVQRGTAWKHQAARFRNVCYLPRDADKRWLFMGEGRTVFDRVWNLCRLPEHPASGGRLDVWHDFITYLIPDEESREYFLNRLAAKTQNPHWIMPAVLHVAKNKYGTGRGTLFDIYRALFGQQNVVEVDHDMLAREGNQSQYNGWQENSLMMIVPEALDAADSNYMSKLRSYERIKRYVEPGEGHRVLIRRKHVQNDYATSHTCIDIATNHHNAFHMIEGDRRVMVIENAPEPRSPDWFLDVMRPWMAQPENIGALWRELRSRDVSTFQAFGAPPVTKAKREMIEGSESDLERGLSDALAVLAAAGFEVVVSEIVVSLMTAMRAAWSVGHPPPNWQAVVAKSLLPKYTESLHRRVEITLGGVTKFCRPRAMPGVDAEKWRKAPSYVIRQAIESAFETAEKVVN